MPTKKPRKQKETQRFIDSAPLVDRWQVCQKIGKVFNDSILTHENLLIALDLLQEKEIFHHTINELFLQQ